MVTDEINPPNSDTATIKLISPWSTVVRRVENEPQFNQSEILSPDGNAGDLVGVIGDVVSWPALSESTRTGSKVVLESVPSSSSHQQVTTNANFHTANNIGLARPKGKNRGGWRGGSHSFRNDISQNNFNRPIGPMPPPFPVVEVPYMVPPTQDTPIGQDTQVGGQRPVVGIGGFRPRTGIDQFSPRNSSRGGHYGPRPRGDGQHNNNHGARRDQVHPTHHYVAPPIGGYVPPPLPHGAGPFMASPQIRMFPHTGFDMVPPIFYVPPMHPDAYSVMSLIPGPSQMPFPPVTEDPDPNTNMIVKQIDYYFSDENLDKDEYLKSKMDEHGLVPVTVIASFRRVQLLTKDVSEILKALRYSIVVEIQGDKLRRRDDWYRWLRPSDSHNVKSGSRTPKNVSEVSVQRVSVTNANDNNTETRQGHTNTTPGGGKMGFH